MLRAQLMAVVLALALAALAPAALGQGSAQAPPVALAQARAVVAADVAAVPATIADPNGRAQVTLYNPAEESVRLRVSPTFRHTGSAASVGATWTRLPEGTAVKPGQEEAIRKGETVTFQAEAHFEMPGSYETFLQVDGSAATVPRRHVLTVIRTAAALPADFLLDPRPARVTLGLSGSSSAGLTRLVGRNVGAEAVELGSARAGRFVALDGEVETSVVTAAPVALANNECKGAIAQKTDCAFDVALPAELGPGRYAVDVAVDGRFGGQSLRSLKVEVRAPPWLAGGMVVLGALVGAFVAFWRTEGRPLLRQLAAAGDVRLLVTRIGATAASPAAAVAARGLLSEIRELEIQIRKGGDREAQTVPLQKRAAALAAAESVGRSVRAAGPDAVALLRLRSEQMDALLVAPRWKAEEVEAASQRLGDELANLPALAAATKAAADLLDRLAPLRRWATADGGVLEAWSRVDTALRSSREPLPLAPPTASAEGAGTTEVGRRAATLASATSGLSALEPTVARQAVAGLMVTIGEPQDDAAKDLKARLDTAGPVPSIEDASKFAAEAARLTGRGTEGGVAPTSTLALRSADSALTLDLDAASWLGLTGSETPSRLRGRALAWEIFTNALVLAMIGMFGVLALWVGNPAWGSVQDLLVAFFGGVGTRLAIGPLPNPAK